MFNSQVKQDVFVNKILQKNEGFFVDIGAGTGGLPTQDPAFYSNTYFFERYRGWKGIAIDYDKSWYESINKKRSCKCVCEDLLLKNINDVLEGCGCPDEIDYLSIDVDDAQIKVFNDFNFDKYKFKVLTLEHNLFQSESSCFQNHTEDHKAKVKSEYDIYRKTLHKHGYYILWGNVILDGYGPVEDWWVNEEIYSQYKKYLKQDINCKEVDNENFIHSSL